MASETARSDFRSPLRTTRARSAALLAGAALAGAAPGSAHAQPGAGARVQAAPCTGSAPTREALRARAGLVEESLARQMVELRAAQVAEAGAAGGARTPRADVVRLLPRGYLGMRTLETSDERLTPAGRVVRYCTYPVVLSVAPASPADRAGLQEGDTLIAYNDRDLVKTGEIELDRLLVPGDTVRVSLRRERRPLTLPVIVGRQRVTSVFRMWEDPSSGRVMVVGEASSTDPVSVGAMAGEARPSSGQTQVFVRTREPRPAVAPGGVGTGGSGGRMVVTTPGAPTAGPQTFTYFGAMGPMPIAGAQFLPMDDDLRAALGVREGGAGGLLVVRVIPGSPAAEFGLRSGDVIRTADGRAVVSPVDLQRALAQAASAPGEDRAVQVELERRGQRKTITLKWSR